jgi:hypothetical protein
MTCEDRVGQVIESFLAGFTLVSTTVFLRVVSAFADHSWTVAVWAGGAVGPAEVSNGLVAFGVVNQGLDVDHA